MNFWKTFLAALVAFIVGVVVIFFYLIGSGVSAIMSMSDAKSATPEQSVLYIDLAENIIDDDVKQVRYQLIEFEGDFYFITDGATLSS